MENEESKIITIYPENLKARKSFGFIFFFVVVIFVIEFCAWMLEKNVIYMILGGIVAIFIGCFLKKMLDKEKEEIKHIKEIKRDGRIVRGNVVHIIRKRISNYTYTKFVIKFIDRGGVEKYIVTPELPYELCTISRIPNQKQTELKEICVKQYKGNGYIEFEENDQNDRDFYKDTISLNNFKKPISCNIYILDGKHVIDDFKSELFKENKKITNKELIWVIIVYIIFAIGFFWILHIIKPVF